MTKLSDIVLPHILEAGVIIEREKMYKKITIKEDGTPVTNADMLASKYLIDSIMSHFPDDIVFTEECMTKLDFSKRVWLIDPLDGTKFFIEGADTYSIMVACVDRGKSIFGAIYYPAKQLIYFAEEGKGTCVIDGGVARKISFDQNPKEYNTFYKPSALKNTQTAESLMN